MARVPAFQAGCCEFESRLPLIREDGIFPILSNCVKIMARNLFFEFGGFADG